MRIRALSPLVLALLLPGCGLDVNADSAPPAAELQADHVVEPDRSASDGAVLPAPPAETWREADSAGDGLAPLTAPVILYSDLDAEVAARMDGVVAEVLVELGDRVQRGQPLAILDDAREQARAASAQAALELARSEFQRVDTLHASGFVTAAERDGALYRLRAAEAAAREAEIELAHTRVPAPFTGVVTRRMTGRGRAVEELEPLFRVTALQPLRGMVRIAEQDARTLRTGTTAIVAGDGGVEVEAVVIRIAPAVDPASGTVEVLLDVPRPGPLRPGSGASVRIDRVGSRP